MPSVYGTIAGADAYHLARGNATWTGNETVKGVALLRGSEYIDGNFRAYFPGLKAGNRAQDREWPRTWAHDREGNAIAADEVPIEAINASYEAALRELVSPGSLSPDFIPGQQEKSVKVDVIAVEYTGPVGVAAFKPVMTIIGEILYPILINAVGARTERV
jgi:hypothetical protein